MVHINSTQSLHEQQEKGSTEAWRRRVFDVYASGEFPGHWPVSQYTRKVIFPWTAEMLSQYAL
jgi:hypothetical protein